MKRYFLLPLLALATAAQAQDSYTNERLFNNSGDVIGTARYVGMGGALGALGADISGISWNPAGIGLYRKNDIALSFGGSWGKSAIEEERRGAGSFDQIGFVYCAPLYNEKCPYLNFAFNYQKKINFNNNFYADNLSLNGLSQMDQLAQLGILEDGWGDKADPQSLARLAVENGFLEKIPFGSSQYYYRNPGYGLGALNNYTFHSEGSLQAFDINFSTNVQDRYFFGLTVGIDNLNYRGWSQYDEAFYYAPEDQNKPYYGLYNDYSIKGYGFNVKLGTIIRPVEDSPFRFGLTVETPTWYRIKSSRLFDLEDYFSEWTYGDKTYRTDLMESYLEYTFRSPWKLRAGIGSTVGTKFAWDVDYELAFYGNTGMGYPRYADDYYYDCYRPMANVPDEDMNQLTKDNFRTTHTMRLGMEYRPTNHWAVRLGYNLNTSAYNDKVTYDQYNTSSPAMDYTTETNYMRRGNTNILTLGVGYRYKSFYMDLAYKVRSQKADFYAFDDSFTQPNSTYLLDVPEAQGAKLSPVEVDLTRQTVTATLGFKF